MWATSDGPKIEDFGISEDDLARAPRLFLSSHRIGVLFAAYLIAAVLVFIVIVETSHSMSAAAFFTIITLAAGSVILLPVLFLLLCAGEKAEERWLCRRVPMLRACLAYERAVAEHRRLTEGRAARPLEPEDWQALSESAYIRQLRSELDRRFPSSVSETERELTGFDFIIDLARQNFVLRCEAGSTPVAASVARELVAALDDAGADAAVIVTAAEATEALEKYIADRPITLAAPWQLDALGNPES